MIINLNILVRKYLVVIVMLAFCAVSVFANQAKVSFDKMNRVASVIRIVDNVGYYCEGESDLNIDQIVQNDTLLWQDLNAFSQEGVVVDLGYIDVWFRLPNVYQGRTAFVIDFSNASEVKLFEEVAGKYKVHVNGKNIPKEQRSYDYKREPWILLSNRTTTTKYLYAKVRYLKKQLDPQIYIYDAEFVQREIIKEKFGEGVFFGATLIVLIISLLMGFTTRSRTEFYYVGYVLSCFFVFLIRNSLVYQFLVSIGLPFFIETAIYIPVSFAIGFYLLVISSYLKLKVEDVFLYRVNWLMTMVTFGMMVFAIVIYHNKNFPIRLLYNSWVVVVFTVSIWVASKFCFIKGYRPARMLLVGNIIPTIGIVLTLIFGSEQQLFWFNHFLEISVLVQIAFFSRGVSDRVRYEMEEKEQAQNRAMVFLEEKVVERTQEVVKQKEIIEIANNEILDSINYASRIQSAILPPLNLVHQYIEDSFVFYKPKAIVAGDFYWMETVGHKIFFTVADCTGHGVPGAMISVMCSNSLTRAVQELKDPRPASVLDKAVEFLEEHFAKSVEDMQDGMDLGLCSLDLSTRSLEYAGANNPLYFIRDGELTEIKPDRQPIGRYMKRKPFTNHVIDVKEGDCFYLSSDGYADQFGGPRGKKFRYVQFRQLLKDIHEKPMASQLDVIEQTIDNWMGDLEQLDDICVMGLRIRL